MTTLCFIEGGGGGTNKAQIEMKYREKEQRKINKYKRKMNK